MELTFVHQYSGDSPKRRRLAKACEHCRSRKKRCVHYEKADGANNDQDSPALVSNDDGPTESRQHRPSTSGNSEVHDSSSAASRRAEFVADLRPESTLLNRPVPSTTKVPNDDIGVWVDRSTWDSLVKQKSDATGIADSTIVTNHGFRHGQRPHSAVLGPLIDLYFERFHPLFPLLEEEEFRRNHAGGLVPEPLVHAMCLVAAKDPASEPHLRLSDSPVTVPPRQFCSILHASIAGALRVPVRFEKITLIRILALMSLHNEGPEGAEEASLWLSQAMHHSQTLCLHLGQAAAVSVGNDLVMKRLFWCLWALDRMNSAINGRPVFMCDIDIAIDPFTPGESGFPAFEAWLRVADVLNKVIAYYRPTSNLSETGWEGAWPILEEMIDTANGWDLPASTLATIHLFYLTVGVLSHRTRGTKELPQSENSHVRQRLLAIEITRLMDDPMTPSLLPLPIIPYAVSLALSVHYQFLRQSQMIHQQGQARKDFKTCVTVLQKLRRTWSSADVMTTLAKRVLEQLERTDDLSSFRIRRKKPGQKDDKDFIAPPTACHDGVGAQAGENVVNGEITDQAETVEKGDLAAAEVVVPDANGTSMFDNTYDDVFSTFLDPNYPTLDDLSFIGNLAPFDWTAEVGISS